MACLYANNPAVQDADDGIALRLARVAELDVELQGHAALRDAARSDVALARAQAEHIEAPPVPPPPPRQQRREVLTTKPESQKDYRGYTFWSSDFHISPIADLKDLFAPMGMRIIDESLSGHCHLKKTCSRNLKVITKQNGITLGQCPNQLRRKFFEAYVNDARMRTVDAFLCHHAAGLCEAFMPFNKSLIVVASTRYEIGRHDPRRWKAWNANLKAIAAHPRNVVAANNRYDAEYVKYFTGLSHVPVLPNYCGWRCGNQRRRADADDGFHAGGYTGVSYNPTRRQILVGPGRGVKDHFVQQLDAAARGKRFQNQPLQFKRIRDLYPHFEYSDLAAHPCIVLIPYQVSLMSIFEYYRMGIPMWAPAPELLAQWQLKYRVMSERTWDLVRKKRPTRGSPLPRAPGASHRHDPNDEFDIKAIAFWIKYADFYEWPHISTFTSFDDLVQQLTDPSLDLRGMSQRVIAYNEEMVRDLKSEWRSIFAKMFRGLQPAASEPREQKRNYDEALLAKYGARQSDRCVGDAFDGAASDWLVRQ